MSYGRSQCEESKEKPIYIYNRNLQREEIYCLNIRLAHSLVLSGNQKNSSVDLVYVGQRFSKKYERERVSYA